MKTKTLWAIMRAVPFSDIVVALGNLPLQSPPEGPDYFIPVFDSKAKAKAWSEGRTEYAITELEVAE